MCSRKRKSFRSFRKSPPGTSVSASYQPGLNLGWKLPPAQPPKSSGMFSRFPIVGQPLSAPLTFLWLSRLPHRPSPSARWLSLARDSAAKNPASPGGHLSASPPPVSAAASAWHKLQSQPWDTRTPCWQPGMVLIDEHPHPHGGQCTLVGMGLPQTPSC